MTRILYIDTEAPVEGVVEMTRCRSRLWAQIVNCSVSRRSALESAAADLIGTLPEAGRAGYWRWLAAWSWSRVHSPADSFFIFDCNTVAMHSLRPVVARLARERCDVAALMPHIPTTTHELKEADTGFQVIFVQRAAFVRDFLAALLEDSSLRKDTVTAAWAAFCRKNDARVSFLDQPDWDNEGVFVPASYGCAGLEPLPRDTTAQSGVSSRAVRLVWAGKSGRLEPYVVCYGTVLRKAYVITLERNAEQHMRNVLRKARRCWPCQMGAADGK